MKIISKPLKFELNVFLSCVIFWCFIYCSFILLIEVISLSIFVGAFLFSVSVFTYGFLWYAALPQPQSELVNDILGCDPKLMKVNKSSIESTLKTTNLSSNDEQPADITDFHIDVIGHRGAGLDAPENSISAFRQVSANKVSKTEFHRPNIDHTVWLFYLITA